MVYLENADKYHCKTENSEDDLFSSRGVASLVGLSNPQVLVVFFMEIKCPGSSADVFRRKAF